MKIRSGFVSNSSNSSFILVNIPENFDPEVYIDYINTKQTKNKKRMHPFSVIGSMKTLIRTGYVAENDGDNDYYDLWEAVYPLKVYGGETEEGAGYIEVINKKVVDRIDKINIEFNVDKMKQATAEIRKKREEMRLKYKHIDPHGEEIWEEDELEEGIKIKKFDQFK